MWESVQEETRVAVRTHYLAALTQETDRSVRNRVCDTISELAHYTRTKQRKSFLLYDLEWQDYSRYDVRTLIIYNGGFFSRGK